MAIINGTFLPDIIIGTSEDDTINGFGGADVLTGGDGNDIIDGGEGEDVLSGGNGDDTLIGGTGFASLLSLYFGGEGNDLMIASAGALLEDFNGGEGIDTVSFALREQAVMVDLSQAGLPVLSDRVQGTEHVIGSAFADDIAGDGGDNLLIGNGGDDLLAGSGGNDVLIGRSGADSLRGGLGNDVYWLEDANDTVVELAGEGDDTVSAATSHQLADGLSVETMTTTGQSGTAAINLIGNELAQSIFGNAGHNLLNGGGGNDQLVGYEGNDILEGGAGFDVMRGNGGDDVYRVEDTLDMLFETGGEGDDLVAASTSFTLGAGLSIESMTVYDQGTTNALNLTGNELGQSISGNDGTNALNGAGGNDLLRGYAGLDYFVFDAVLGAANADVIADFVRGTDRIAIDNAVFVGLIEGNLGAEAFAAGGAAADANDRIVYNQATGQLFFDADGNGAGTAVLFATLSGAPALAASDFMIV